MRDFTNEILELIRITSTDLPKQVEDRLRKALQNEEPGSPASIALEMILKNVEITRQNSSPICQDTGTPLFYVRHPLSTDTAALNQQIRHAVELATQKTFLRPNAVDPLNGANTGNNLGDERFPSVHFRQLDGEEITIDLILKGGGCENMGAQYSLPDETIHAGRDLEGVRKAALDAVYRAQGQGCAPGFLGIAIGGDRGTSYAVSTETFLRDPDDRNPNDDLAKLEDRITTEANELGIGPMGFGGKTTLLGTKIAATCRVPASFFVTVSYMCWAYRHHRMVVRDAEIIYQ